MAPTSHRWGWRTRKADTRAMQKIMPTNKTVANLRIFNLPASRFRIHPERHPAPVSDRGRARNDRLRERESNALLRLILYEKRV
jgi:hypothetical protein